MKKRFVWILSFLLLLTLCACGGGGETVYDVDYGGRTYTVDTEAKTITVDGNVCAYELSSQGGDVDFHVTYPDGSTYFKNFFKGGSAAGGSLDYDEDRYASGETLWTVLMSSPDHPIAESQRASAVNPLLAILLIAIGIFNAAAPKASWWLSYGWRYKNAEPSDLSLVAARISGVVAIAIGLVCFFV